MDSRNEGSEGNVLPPEALKLFGEGISLVLSRWTALQMAVEHQWGGRDSRQKSSDLASSILSWFTQSKDPLYIDDLENLLDETMAISFNTEIEDGSIEEVAEQLMVMHDECFKGNYEPIGELRESVLTINAISQSKQVINDGDDESSEEEKSSDMMVDEPKMAEAIENPKSKETCDAEAIENPKSKETCDEEGWSVVNRRQNRGSKG